MVRRYGIGCALAALFILAAAGLGDAVHAGRNTSPQIVPNVALPRGNSYGEWGAAWWQWAASTTLAESPILDTTGEFCGVNQSGGVFFLAGTFGTAEMRTCTVPHGKMIFFPIVNAVAWAPEDCSDEASCAAVARASMDLVDILELEIDGVSVGGLGAYRADFGPFALDLDPGTLFVELGLDPGTRDPAVSDGFYIMLHPLSAGEHVVQFRGGASSIPFETEVTYFLTVEGQRPSRAADSD